MPNANRRRGAYSGWTRRRGAAERPLEPPARLERSLRRGPPAETSGDVCPRKSASSAYAAELDKVVVFCLDETGRVLRSGEVDFTSRNDLARQLAEDVRRYPVVEAWQGCVCLLRLGAPVWPGEIDDET